jgi:predicted ATP-grasp superfamily ATP-dependent carboligase
LKVLIGEISSYKSIVIAKFLKENYSDIIVFGFDYSSRYQKIHTKYCDVFYRVTSPRTNKKLKLSQIKSILLKKHIDFFLPVNSQIYNDCIEYKDILGEAFGYIGDFDSYKILNNKDLLYERFSKEGIKMPFRYDNMCEATIPFVVKPTNQSSAKGVKYIFTNKEKEKISILTLENHIIQQYVKGIGCGYSVFAKQGEIITGFGHKRLAEFPASGGSSVYRTNYDDVRMERIAAKVLKITNWSGFAMFEFKLTQANELYLIEVNPRIWGSINQGLQNGVNYFEALLGKVNKEHVGAKNTYLSPLIYLTFLEYILKLNVAPLISFVKNFRSNKPDISFTDDPKGYVSIILRKFS